ncbi:MAG TPA: mandelate racemase/muconate lactonizing enzyme family protein [Firmicutes bacterium]|nr:mandelate racemase/muconate lactonizing enzyme family protein [Bacillota bacterium]
MKTDIKILDVALSSEKYDYRTPIKFGGRVGTGTTILNAIVHVRDKLGGSAGGTGSMTMGTNWSWPDPEVPMDVKYSTLLTIAGRVARQLDQIEPGHPMEIGEEINRIGMQVIARLQAELKLSRPIPKMAMMVAVSPLDAAVHDAYGRLLGRSVYNCYSAEYIKKDLSHYLDDRFKGEFLDRYTRRTPVRQLPLYHLVGALDPLTPAEVVNPVGDEYPESLDEWIRRDGLTHLKIKLNGEDLDWDIGRVVAVDRVATLTNPEIKWRYSLDFNEKCRDVGYLLSCLEGVRRQSEAAFDRIQYIEQPTDRDLFGPQAFAMHEVAAIKPVVIDESLTDYATLLRARELGYSGVALKACKGQTESLLMAAAAQKFGMFLCVQDLTCPGRAFAWSAGLAAHIPGVAAVEGNARQFVPAANKVWQEKLPELFTVKNGCIDTSVLRHPGLGYGE